MQRIILALTEVAYLDTEVNYDRKKFDCTLPG
jgi:hypothetical protein